MIIETGWLNDDFIKNQNRLRISDEDSLIEFIIKLNKEGNINPSLYGRLLIKKAIRVYKELKLQKLNGYLGSHELN